MKNEIEFNFLLNLLSILLDQPYLEVPLRYLVTDTKVQRTGT